MVLYTVAQLRKKAKAAGIEGRSTMKKAQLLRALGLKQCKKVKRTIKAGRKCPKKKKGAKKGVKKSGVKKRTTGRVGGLFSTPASMAKFVQSLPPMTKAALARLQMDGGDVVRAIMELARQEQALQKRKSAL